MLALAAGLLALVVYDASKKIALEKSRLRQNARDVAAIMDRLPFKI